MKKIFPLSYKVDPDSVKSIMLCLCVYAIIYAVVHFIGVMIPNGIFNIVYNGVGALVKLYCIMGAVIATLVKVGRFS